MSKTEKADISKQEPNNLVDISFKGRLPVVLSMLADNMRAMNEAPVAPKKVGRTKFRIFLLFSSFDNAFEQTGQFFV